MVEGGEGVEENEPRVLVIPPFPPSAGMLTGYSLYLLV